MTGGLPVAIALVVIVFGGPMALGVRELRKLSREDEPAPPDTTEGPS